MFCIPWRIYTETCSKDGEEIKKSTPSPKSFQFKKETIEIDVPEGNEKLHIISVKGDTYQSNIGIEEDLDLKDIDSTQVFFPKDGS